MATVLVLFGLVTVLVVCANSLPADSESSDVSKLIPKQIKWNVNVELEQALRPYEKVGISGDGKALGWWSPSNVVFLNSTGSSTKWSGSIRVPSDSKLNYRYFIGFVDSKGHIQIRRWETHVDGRHVQLRSRSVTTNDRFGIVKDTKHVHKGWLNTGTVVQFKLIRNPIQLNDGSTNSKIFVKVTPIDLSDEYSNDGSETIAKPQQAVVECSRFQYGNSQMQDQPDNGLPYEKDDIVICEITTSELGNIAYKFTIFEQNEDNPEELGSTYVNPEDISSSAGIIDLAIHDNDGNPIGSIKIRYLLIKPLPKPLLTFKNPFVTFWRKHWRVLDIAHRGIRNALNIAPLTENTIAAMRKADREGADMIETDVQMTKDGQAIIYHNFYISTSNQTSPKTKEDLQEKLIKDLTYSQMMSEHTYEIIGGEMRAYKPQNMEKRRQLRKFPLLEDLLKKVDHTLGYDIEIKWPQAFYNGELESKQTMDKNMYVDSILDVILGKGCGRLTLLTSVDADVCRMLQLKQNMYGVLFTGPTSENYYEDPRSDNLKQMINNAQAMENIGVVANTFNFLENGSGIKWAKDMDMLIFIYGDASNSTEMVEYFKSLNPTGVIYPRVDLNMPNDDNGKKAFDGDGDLPGYFGRQCQYNSSRNFK